MKLKSFGLIEAILGSAIIIIFAVAMSLLSAKSLKTVTDITYEQAASLVAKDYLARIYLLRNTGRLSFKRPSEDSQVIPVDCFSTDEGNSCKSRIMDSYPQNRFPFFDMISDQSLGNYMKINADYLKNKKITGVEFNIKAKIDQDGCKKIEKMERECREVYIEIIWDQKGKTHVFSTRQLLLDNS
jgi:hypothetical protein